MASVPYTTAQINAGYSRSANTSVMPSALMGGLLEKVLNIGGIRVVKGYVPLPPIVTSGTQPTYGYGNYIVYDSAGNPLYINPNDVVVAAGLCSPDLKAASGTPEFVLGNSTGPTISGTTLVAGPVTSAWIQQPQQGNLTNVVNGGFSV